MPRTSTVERADHPCFEAAAASDDHADADALTRFLDHGDSEAFEGIVRRHGPSVMRQCRKVLGFGPDAEDAFQATFVVLVRNAGSIRQADALGAWLRGVARRVATRARIRSKLIREREAASVDAAASTRDDRLDVELPPAIRAEVDRLPEKFRVPIELCYWQGLSNEQAAEAMACPTGTVKWRLARGREILRGRLVRSGLTLLAFLMFWRRPALGAGGSRRIAVSVAGPRVSAGLSDDLVRRTLAAAIMARNGYRPTVAIASRVVAGSAARRGRWFFSRWMLMALAVSAATLAAIPAVRAAWSAQAEASRTAVVPLVWPTPAPAAGCSE